MIKRQSQRRNRGALVLALFALLAGIGWLGWKQGLFGKDQGEKAFDAKHGLQTNVSGRAVASGVEESITQRSSLGAPGNEVKSATNIGASKSPALLEAQIALDRLALSPGSIDGVPGAQTRAAMRAFQAREGLPATGELDAATRAQLIMPNTPLATRRIETTELDRLLPLPSTWLGKSEQPRLDYETVLELIAERSHAHPKLLQRLNPALIWDSIAPGTIISIPATDRLRPDVKAALVRIRMADRTLQAFDSTNRLLAHFPCSIAANVDKRPVGELRVTVVVPNPDYMFNPENFPESPEARELGRKLRLNPGPNNPVGTAWIGLNLPGYGIHGTPKPEDVGRTESHGCFRLANWNAEYLLQLVTVGTRVIIEQ